MERTLITWNLPNWFSVLLMAGLGYVILGAVAQFVIRRNGSGGQVGG